MTKTTLVMLTLLSKVAVAQIRNSSFEDRNRPPVQRSNIGPLQQGYPYSTPDLKEWYHPGSVGGYSTGIDDSPDYIASDGDTYVNPVTFYPTIFQVSGFSAHTGISCVQIGQSESRGVHGQDEFVTQELNQSLTPGHIYHAAFWALREPGSPVRTKLALSITDGDPNFDSNNNTLLPSPANKVIISGDIQQRYVWTKVEGDILIPTNEPNNKWLTIGFDRSNQIPDVTAPDDYPITGVGYAIDDVSLVDMGCPYVAYPQVVQDDPENWRNKNQAQFVISNRAPGVSYTITNIQFANPTVQPGDTRPSFIVKGGGGHAGPVYYGYFTITASYGCTSVTTDPIEVEYRIGTTPGGRTASSEATTAYPNPAAESIAIPDGVEGATLIDDKGKAIRTADDSGKLDVQSIPDGLYNLQMMQNGKLINQRIQVKH